MTDVEFTSKPSLDSMDNTECRSNGCDNMARKVVRFRNPKQYIPYCRQHVRWARSEFANAKTTLDL